MKGIVVGDFGHETITGSFGDECFHIDQWGAGPFMFRINGKRIFFEDSDMFGPFVIRVSDWMPKDRQPGENHPFWKLYSMWRENGRATRGNGRVKVAVWHIK